MSRPSVSLACLALLVLLGTGSGRHRNNVIKHRANPADSSSAEHAAAATTAGGGVREFADPFPNPVAHAQKLPHFIYLRQPQLFPVSWPFIDNVSTAAANLSAPMDLVLYSVIPDSVAGKAYLLFSYGKSGMSWATGEVEAALPTSNPNPPCDKSHPCRNLAPFLREQRVGKLRCTFSRADGTAAVDKQGLPLQEPVEVLSAWIAFTRILVGTCTLPAAVDSWLADSAAPPPTIRVLHEHDDGAGLRVQSKEPDTIGNSFFEVDGLECEKMRTAIPPKAFATKQSCAEHCLSMNAYFQSRPCSTWQWDAASRSCSYSRHYPGAKSCWLNASVIVGTRRHESWDLVDTSRTEADRRLVTFSGPGPVFGDGRYVDRVAQWIEYHLLNFPDAHFFIYARGGDGRGGYADVMNSLPASAGAVAPLHPYIEAGVVTVVWVPLDPASAVLPSKHQVMIRDENDYLYRAKHLSEWVCSGLDYDEYIAPVHTMQPNKFAVPGRTNKTLDLSRRSSGKWLFPIAPYLRRISPRAGQIQFRKWPAKSPNVTNFIFMDTDEIAASTSPAKLGKYFVRSEAAQVLFTHTTIFYDSVWANLSNHVGHARLFVGKVGFEILHFRERDWQDDVAAGNVVGYGAALSVAAAVKQRMWKRFTTVAIE